MKKLLVFFAFVFAIIAAPAVSYALRLADENYECPSDGGTCFDTVVIESFQ